MYEPQEQGLAHGSLHMGNQRSATLRLSGGVATRAVRYDATRKFLLAQSSKGVESSSGLECPDALVIFTFEEEFDLRSSGSLSFEWRTDQCFWGLRCRCEM